MEFFLLPAPLQTTLYRMYLQQLWGHTHEKEDLTYGNGCVTGRRHGKMCAISKTQLPPQTTKQEDES